MGELIHFLASGGLTVELGIAVVQQGMFVGMQAVEQS
jgi:hypothetical protein